MLNTVLLVDDSATARMVIKRCLEIAGLYDTTFLEGRDGKEALELARQHKPELILSDLNMPIMDGASLLMELKADSELRAVPVVIITSSQNEALVDELVDVGAFRVISKPVTPASIADLLKELEQEQ